MRRWIVNGAFLLAGASLCFLKSARIWSLKSKFNREVNDDSRIWLADDGDGIGPDSALDNGLRPGSKLTDRHAHINTHACPQLSAVGDRYRAYIAE